MATRQRQGEQTSGRWVCELWCDGVRAEEFGWRHVLFRSAAVGERRLALLEAVRELVEKAYPGGVAKHDVDTCVRVLGAVVDGGEISLVEEEDAECTLRVCLLLIWKPEDRGRGARRAAGGVGRRAAALFSAALGMSREVQQQVDKRDRLATGVQCGCDGS